MSDRESSIELIMNAGQRDFYEPFTEMVQILGKDLKFFSDVELGDTVVLNFHDDNTPPRDAVEDILNGDFSKIVDRWTYLVESIRITPFNKVEDHEFSLYPPRYMSGARDQVLKLCGVINDQGDIDKQVTVKVLKLQRQEIPLENESTETDNARTGQVNSKSQTHFPRIRPNRRAKRRGWEV